MTRFLLIAFVFIFNFNSNCQEFSRDIFDNLIYESEYRNYKAYLKKNIFDDLIFTDNRDNEITLRKKYIDLHYGNMLENEEIELDVFRSLLETHSYKSNYEATYSVDILGKIKIEDNEDNSIEISEDIFGNTTIHEERGGEYRTIKQNLNGEYTFKTNHAHASLKEDIFNRWVYKDSDENELKISSKTWNVFLQKYGNDEHIFRHLIHEFLNY